MKKLFSLILAAGLWAGTAPASAAADPLLPDLGMAQVSGVKIDTTTMPGHTLLRYTAIMVDVGTGPLELIGSRPDTSTPTMSVVQRIQDSSGTSSDVPVATTMFYAGDGHNHWHTQDIEGGWLIRLDNGVKVGALAKHGFCFYDNVKYRLTLPGAPQTPFWTNAACDPRQPDALSADMGLSVGWGDSYPASTNFQWIDITGLSSGRYRLRMKADPKSVIQESNETNNGAWANLQINAQTDTVTVLHVGPGA
jgi:hypothetical protein